MTASRYLPSAKYRCPLSKYFCLRTLGSREQPMSSPVKQAIATSAGTREERFITNSPRGALCALCFEIVNRSKYCIKKLFESFWRHPDALLSELWKSSAGDIAIHYTRHIACKPKQAV